LTRLWLSLGQAALWCADALWGLIVLVRLGFSADFGVQAKFGH
jgi:hypothetical protein